MDPLVSCIMPTCNRRAFVSHAIRYFLRQDYDNKELVIVDDGTDPVEDLIPGNTPIRYIRMVRKISLGEKRNLCVRESLGDLIMHWDDDDWMAPYRISYQVRELTAHKAEVCGLREMLYYEFSSGKCWLYRYPPHAKPWLAGNSLLYTKDFWKKSPFPDLQVASDTQFIWSHRLDSAVIPDDNRFYVATIHDNNTSPKITGKTCWIPCQKERIKEIMAGDWPVYVDFVSGKNGEKPLHACVKEQMIPAENLVSVCLLSYKRPGNIQTIIDSIHPYDFIDEILVWNNNSSNQLYLKGKKVRLIGSEENMMCWGRFLCAGQAKNDMIYVQDDDVIVKNIPLLYAEFLKDSDRITHALNSNHYRLLDKYRYPEGQVALLGWGAFFRKSWLGILDKYLEKNENDYLFRREADQIFSLSLNTRHKTIPASLTLLNHNSTQGIALYLEPDHNLFKALAVNRALAFIRKSKSNPFPVTWNVVIPCRNYGKYLADAVHSVLYNSADYVITIVDDHSSDNTKEVATQLTAQYPFIRYIRLEENKGVSFARNKGISAVDSVFVVLLDADDKIGPDYLFDAERMLRKGCDVVNPDAVLFGEKNTRWEVPDSVKLPMLLQKNRVHIAAAFRRSYWAQVGGMDETMDNWQDWEFWIRLAEAGARIKRITGNHFYYRKHGHSKSMESNLKSETLRKYIRIKHNMLYHEAEK